MLCLYIFAPCSYLSLSCLGNLQCFLPQMTGATFESDIPASLFVQILVLVLAHGQLN